MDEIEISAIVSNWIKKRNMQVHNDVKYLVHLGNLVANSLIKCGGGVAPDDNNVLTDFENTELRNV